MDNAGHCQELRGHDISMSTEVNFSGFTGDQLKCMAILAGCDYVESINGIGLKKAAALVKQHHTLDKAIRKIRFEGKLVVPNIFEKEAELALLTFKHQRVWDPVQKRIVHLQPLPEGFAEKYADQSFLGPDIDADIFLDICAGLRDPHKQRYFSPKKADQQETLDGSAPQISTNSSSNHHGSGANVPPVNTRSEDENFYQKTLASIYLISCNPLHGLPTSAVLSWIVKCRRKHPTNVAANLAPLTIYLTTDIDTGLSTFLKPAGAFTDLLPDSNNNMTPYQIYVLKDTNNYMELKWINGVLVSRPEALGQVNSKLVWTTQSQSQLK